MSLYVDVQGTLILADGRLNSTLIKAVKAWRIQSIANPKVKSDIFVFSSYPLYMQKGLDILESCGFQKVYGIDKTYEILLEMNPGDMIVDDSRGWRELVKSMDLVAYSPPEFIVKYSI